MRLLSEVEKALGLKLQVVDVFQHPNIAQLAAIIDEQLDHNERVSIAQGKVATEVSQHSHIHLLHSASIEHNEQALAPVFCFAGVGGHVTQFQTIASGIEGHDVYAIQPLDVSWHDGEFVDYNDLAEFWLAQIAAIHQGPYYIVAHSAGTLVTRAILQKVSEQQVLGAILLDPPMPKLRQLELRDSRYVFIAQVAVNSLMTAVGVFVDIDWGDLESANQEYINEFVAEAVTNKGYVLSPKEFAELVAQFQLYVELLFSSTEVNNCNDISVVFAEQYSKQQQEQDPHARLSAWEQSLGMSLTLQYGGGGHFSMLQGQDGLHLSKTVNKLLKNDNV